MLSEIQVENQQKLKDREQELKDMKKMMEVMKVGSQQGFMSCKLSAVLPNVSFCC